MIHLRVFSREIVESAAHPTRRDFPFARPRHCPKRMAQGAVGQLLRATVDSRAAAANGHRAHKEAAFQRTAPASIFVLHSFIQPA